MAPDLDTPPGMARHGFTAMGTAVSVLLPGPALPAAARVEALFADWEGRLSRFRPDSALMRLNASAGAEVIVDPLVYEVADAALAAAAATDGRFDPTLLHPLVELGYDRSFADLPADRPQTGLEPRARGGGWREVRLDPRVGSITLPAGVGLEFGGIAKGMAVDAAIELLASAGITPAAVEAGGDLAVHGTLPGSDGWPVEVELPDGTLAIAIDHGAVATSTIDRRRWRVGGSERHHLIDPLTGRPAASDLRSVTAAAPTCRQAEVAAKTALLLGSRDGAAFLASLGFGGLMVALDGSLRQVGSWEQPATHVGPAAEPVTQGIPR